jgi:dGTP triphosphohydrolase
LLLNPRFCEKVTRQAVFEQLQSLEEAKYTNHLKDDRLAECQEQISLLQSLANKSSNVSAANSKLMNEVVLLRHQNSELAAAQAQSLSTISHLKSQLNQATAENMLGSARVRNNVAAALSVARKEFDLQQRELSETLSRVVPELESFRLKSLAVEEEMTRMRAQHEETITKLAQRKTVTGNSAVEAALRQKIAELEESLGVRDEEAMRWPRGPPPPPPASAAAAAAVSTSAKRNINKKFKIGKE